MRASRRGPTGMGIIEALVDALADAGLANDTARRLLFIQLISDELEQPPVIPDQAAGRDHLIEIVTVCSKIDNGIAAMLQAIEVMRPDSAEYHRIRHLVTDPQVLDVLTKSEFKWLQRRLAETSIPELNALVRRAAGPGANPAWHQREASALDALSYLLDINADSDGIPPLMRFVDLVADRVGGEPGKEMASWNERLARRLNLGRELQEIRDTRIPDTSDAPLYLVIAIGHDAIDPDRYLVSFWRQDDAEWLPAFGGTRTVGRHNLERTVDELVTSSEIAWSANGGAATLEFILPRSLLNLPVHLWRKDFESGDPRPLCLDYPIVVRSMERMRNTQWHRVWRRRWQTLMERPSSARVHFADPGETQQAHQLDAMLGDRRWVLMVLSAPPQAEAAPGGDELASALRSGLPTLIWAYEDGPAKAVRDTVAQLTQSSGLGNLPARVQEIRRAAFLTSPINIDINIARRLVVLWDDPTRLIALD